MENLDKIKNVFGGGSVPDNIQRNGDIPPPQAVPLPLGKGGFVRTTDGSGIKPVGPEQIRRAWGDIEKYKRDKESLEKKIVSNEDWWKLRHWAITEDGKERDTQSSAWLWNVIVSKHADAMDAFPEPNLLPRGKDDREEAKKLTSIIPVILEQNDFRKTYSDIQWYKLKQGAGVYGIFWDQTKHNGLGDIAIKDIDALSLFWEGGIEDIQNSKQVFYVTLQDTDLLKSQYPELEGKLQGDKNIIPKYNTDDNIDTTGKTAVVDWYYHKYAHGRKILHYCKFAGSEVLFATENEPERYPNGWYDHGLYPFVIDPLFPVEGTPFGYGYVDIFKGVQKSIDLLDSAVVKNALMAAKPRYFIRGDGSVNEGEFADWNKDFVHTNGNLGQDSVQKIEVPLLNGNYHNLLDAKKNELKETSGNRDVNNGGTGSGITAASAIAAMQEAGGKLSRDASSMSYYGFRLVVKQCIELVRQFYDLPRQFRITGEQGQVEFTSYSNAYIKPQQQTLGGKDIGVRCVEFDIEVVPQKATAYSKMAQNELAIQLYNLGVFNTQNADQAMALLEVMDFDHKERVIEKIQMNAGLQARLVQLAQFSLAMAKQYDPMAMNTVMQIFRGTPHPSAELTPSPQGEGLIENDVLGGAKSEEHGRVSNARAQAQQAAMPN